MPCERGSDHQLIMYKDSLALVVYFFGDDLNRTGKAEFDIWVMSGMLAVTVMKNGGTSLGEQGTVSCCDVVVMVYKEDEDYQMLLYDCKCNPQKFLHGKTEPKEILIPRQQEDEEEDK